MANSSASTPVSRAIELASRGRFRVEPNPPVGCVLVRDGETVGEGWHPFFGGPHAEVVALGQAGGRARGATAYVTLEPCAHHGKTPPCADALIEAGVAEVVYAHADPNPATARRGPRRLRKAGIRVRKVRTPAALRELMAPYLGHVRRRRPWVIAKWAMTLDGRIATRRGDSKWITSEAARGWAHRHLRASADAIAVGSGTVIADDPSLTSRAPGPQPLRIVVCGRRALWPRAKVLSDRGRTLLAAPARFRPPKGVDVFFAGALGKVDVRRLLAELHARGVRRLLVEGGGALLGSFFDAGLVDQAAVFVAPRIIGGTGAVQAIGGRGRGRIAEAPRLVAPAWHRLGEDIVIEGYLSG